VKNLQENNMATKKKLIKETSNPSWPKVTQGSHSTITEHEDGRVDMTWDWDKLNKDINDAISQWSESQKINHNSSTPTRKSTSKSKTKKANKNELA
jgi:hypothetical protein